MSTIIPDFEISEFKGLNTVIKDLKTIEKEYTPDALNWITAEEKDHIELRRGQSLLGQTRIDGNGKINGLGVLKTKNGTEIPYFAYGRKLKRYDSLTDDTVEIGTDTLPASAINDDVSICKYQNLAGYFGYISSPNSSIYKIHTANPDTIKDQGTTNYRGWLKFGQGRAVLINRKNSSGIDDKLNVYFSYIDKDSATDYDQVTGENVGALGSTHYTHTLTQITGVRSAFAILVSANVSAGTEIFTDDGDGNMVSNYGGTGTINYMTGALDITFSDTTTGAVTCDYFWENATDNTAGSADGAILDFSFSVPRTVGQGNLYPQLGGGNVKGVGLYADTFYCLHDILTWQLSLTSDDTASTNLPYREKMGTPTFRSYSEGSDGIYFLDKSNPSKPMVKLLSLGTSSQSNPNSVGINAVIPKEVSEALELSDFEFDYAVVYEWGKYILLACQQKRDGVADTYNSRAFVYNKQSRAWDMTDYLINCLDTYNGSLISGDSISNNVFTLFSGFDDDDTIINNYYTTPELSLKVGGVKKFHRLKLQGLIQTNQEFDVSLSFDGGAFSVVGTIKGDGSYVSIGEPTSIGSRTLGLKPIGGGGGIEYAFPYTAELKVNTQKFEYVRLKLEAKKIGYVSVNKIIFKDIRYKGRKSLPIYVTT